MHKQRRSKNGHRPDRDNVCSYCLFFQPYPEGNRPLRGNCTYHKEWIVNASRTTCSEMSSLPLKETGIYEVVGDDANGWTHVRRTTKLRTRLFLVKRSEVDGIKG